MNFVVSLEEVFIRILSLLIFCYTTCRIANHMPNQMTRIAMHFVFHCEHIQLTPVFGVWQQKTHTRTCAFG